MVDRGDSIHIRRKLNTVNIPTNFLSYGEKMSAICIGRVKLLATAVAVLLIITGLIGFIQTTSTSQKTTGVGYRIIGYYRNGTKILLADIAPTYSNPPEIALSILGAPQPLATTSTKHVYMKTATGEWIEVTQLYNLTWLPYIKWSITPKTVSINITITNGTFTLKESRHNSFSHKHPLLNPITLTNIRDGDTTDLSIYVKPAIHINTLRNLPKGRYILTLNGNLEFQAIYNTLMTIGNIIGSINEDFEVAETTISISGSINYSGGVLPSEKTQPPTTEPQPQPQEKYQPQPIPGGTSKFIVSVIPMSEFPIKFNNIPNVVNTGRIFLAMFITGIILLLLNIKGILATRICRFM